MYTGGPRGCRLGDERHPLTYVGVEGPGTVLLPNMVPDFRDRSQAADD